MGYTCKADAAHRLEAIEEWCHNHGGCGQATSWIDPRTGVKSFFEVSRRDQRDGGICATIHRMVDETHCVRAGNLRIDGDGRGFRGPAVLKAAPFYLWHIGHGFARYWSFARQGQPSEQTLWESVLLHAKSFEPGGVNQHIFKSLGYIPYPVTAIVRDGKTGNVVAGWEAGLFQVW